MTVLGVTVLGVTVLCEGDNTDQPPGGHSEC